MGHHAAARTGYRTSQAIWGLLGACLLDKRESCCFPDVTGRGHFSEASIPWGITLRSSHSLRDTLFPPSYSVQVDSSSASTGGILSVGPKSCLFLKQELLFTNLVVGSCSVWGISALFEVAALMVEVRSKTVPRPQATALLEDRDLENSNSSPTFIYYP